MKEKHITIKVWRKTLTKLRLLAALREMSMVSVLDEISTAALQKREAENAKNNI